MVLTRSQYNQLYGSDGDHSRSFAQSISSESESEDLPKRPRVAEQLNHASRHSAGSRDGSSRRVCPSVSPHKITSNGADKSDMNEKDGTGEGGERLGRGCRVVRQALSFEEEIMLMDEQRIKARQARFSNLRKILHPERASTNSISESRTLEMLNNHLDRNGRPEREGVTRALERVRELELDDEDSIMFNRTPHRREEPRFTESSRYISDEPYKSLQRNKKTYNNDSFVASEIFTDDGSDAEMRSMSSSDGDGEPGIPLKVRENLNLLSKRQSLGYCLDKMLRQTEPVELLPRTRGRGGVRECGRPITDEAVSEKTRGGGGGEAEGVADVVPVELDKHTSFEQVGGLPDHILALREMVLIPLLYPEVLKRLHIQPPRGVLFVGPPGTGKTLMARALAGEGSRVGGGTKVTFFLRRGADVLSKWLGESERQLRLLFEEAQARQPSIIFFDEVDGLAPVRHSKQEQSQAAVVSTLLALMDGLQDRGNVIVIGATNRPDTLDPALRRPGRFDRELRFPLPDASARQQILNIHMQHQTFNPESARATIRAEMSSETTGWSGADLGALCTEAALHALRRAVPQIYVRSQRLDLGGADVSVKIDDYRAALRRVGVSVLRSASARRESAATCPAKHMAKVLELSSQTLLHFISHRWGPVAAEVEKIVTEQKLGLENCNQVQQLVFALTTQQAKPPAALQRGMMLFLTGISTLKGESPLSARQDNLFITTETAKLMCTSLPGLASYVVHLPNLDWQRGGANASGVETNGEDILGLPSGVFSGSRGSILNVLDSARASAPSVLMLLGLENWLESGPSEDDITFLEYNLRSLLASADVLILCPAGDYEGIVKPCLGSVLDWTHLLVIPEPPKKTKEEFLRSLYHQCAQAQRAADEHLRAVHAIVHAGLEQQGKTEAPSTQLPWGELPEAEVATPAHENGTTPPLSRRERVAQRLDWEYICYKRQQLLYLIHSWLLTFTMQKRFNILLSGNLDLTPDHEDWKAWRKHVTTHDRRPIGLQDIVINVERGRYRCMSQFTDDIDMLCNNVKTFFSYADTKYRPKVSEIKQFILLSLHRVHKRLLHVCEVNRNAQPPESLVDTSDESNNGSSTDGENEKNEQKQKNSTFSETQRRSSAASRKRRRRRARWADDPPRRRRRFSDTVSPADKTVKVEQPLETKITDAQNDIEKDQSGVVEDENLTKEEINPTDFPDNTVSEKNSSLAVPNMTTVLDAMDCTAVSSSPSDQFALLTETQLSILIEQLLKPAAVTSGQSELASCRYLDSLYKHTMMLYQAHRLELTNTIGEKRSPTSVVFGTPQEGSKEEIIENEKKIIESETVVFPRFEEVVSEAVTRAGKECYPKL